MATPEHIEEAFRLLNVSTEDAARSGINEHLNLSPEIANEIKVSLLHPKLKPSVFNLLQLLSFSFTSSHQHAEAQLQSRRGIGSHISERRLLDELHRMGLNESIVSILSSYTSDFSHIQNVMHKNNL